jgi:pilus assembly protein Flp/PilA
MNHVTSPLVTWQHGVHLMINLARNLIADESGAAAAEYALILAIVGAAIGGAAFLLGNQVKTSITGAAQQVKNCSATVTTGCVQPTLT